VIRERSEELHAFHARHFAEPIGERPASAKGHRSELTDEEVIKLIREAKNAAQFERFWLGDVRSYPACWHWHSPWLF
jgi:hypothetical protein